ncbi:hypothetical protein DL768_008935 [Monosporascus sp. mg162]|nr:hypothetical protein DL768_008935 [Monosporascus sp. mg162]
MPYLTEACKLLLTITFRVERVPPDIKTEALTRFMNIYRPSDARLNAAWIFDLSGLFAEAGMEDAESDNRDRRRTSNLPATSVTC